MSTAAAPKKPSKPVLIMRWTLQIVVALAFLAAGAAKLAGAPPMIAIFEQIGVGQWFRFVTAAVEIVGALLLLLPSRAGVGAILLACTMIGALATHTLVIGGNWVPAAVLLLLNLVLIWLNRARLQVAPGLAV